MKYIVLDLQAIDEFVSNRFLQSTEYEAGANLACCLMGEKHETEIAARINAVSNNDGIFMIRGGESPTSKYLIIDCEQSEIFSGMNRSDTLFAFQKLIRFSKKLWQGFTLTFSERVFSGTSKAVLFVRKGYQPAPFRITLEKDPWGERLAKRGHKGNFILAYKAGHEGGDAAKEIAGLTNFRKAYELITETSGKLTIKKISSTGNVEAGNQLNVSTLADVDGKSTNSLFKAYSDWLPLMTTQQRRFVEAPLGVPYRIEGAAGTGKTLCLMLKSIYSLKAAEQEDQNLNLVFVTHSDATKRSILDVLNVMGGQIYVSADRNSSSQTLKVCTLSELCAEELRQSISASEFIDRDAMESKGLQLLYIMESITEVMEVDFPSHERFLSEKFASFMRADDKWKLAEMLQHEISVVIKGRAAENLDVYKKLPPLKYGVPISSNSDKGFVYTVFRAYQKRLGAVGQFDTDDVVISAIGQLDTPIWRRRRVRDGYDAIFIDETHLFNINELSIFHFFTKVSGPYAIAYSVDRSQAVGDRGWTTHDITLGLTAQEGDESSNEGERINTVFRSSPDIVNLAFSIVSSGATLFTNFDNPLDHTASGFTDAEERLSEAPVFLSVPNESAMIDVAFERAEQLQKDLGCKRSEILIVTLDEKILDKLSSFAHEKNKAHLVLRKRGDSLAVKSASASGQMIIGHADYVGGLEFFAVVLVGIDGGRVPPAADDLNESSKNFLSYASHNRLYVAVSRAKYRVEFIGEKARGPSKLLTSAIAEGLLNIRDAE